MFAAVYFAPVYFPPVYFAEVGAAPSVAAPGPGTAVYLFSPPPGVAMASSGFAVPVYGVAMYGTSAFLQPTLVVGAAAFQAAPVPGVSVSS